jgi:hypothetical protein
LLSTALIPQKNHVSNESARKAVTQGRKTWQIVASSSVSSSLVASKKEAMKSFSALCNNIWLLTLENLIIPNEHSLFSEAGNELGLLFPYLRIVNKVI